MHRAGLLEARRGARWPQGNQHLPGPTVLKALAYCSRPQAVTQPNRWVRPGSYPPGSTVMGARSKALCREQAPVTAPCGQ